MKNISDYIEPRANSKILIQALVPRNIAMDVKNLLDKQHISWSKFILACLQKFLDEQKSNPGG